MFSLKLQPIGSYANKVKHLLVFVSPQSGLIRESGILTVDPKTTLKKIIAAVCCTYSHVVRFSGTPSLSSGLFRAPLPIQDGGKVFTVFIDVLSMFEQGVANRLFGIGRARTELRQAVDYVLH